jgi:hypothetical protein
MRIQNEINLLIPDDITAALFNKPVKTAFDCYGDLK